MTMNIPVQNADYVAELVFAMVLNSARNSFDGDSGMTTDAPSHDERVMQCEMSSRTLSDEEVTDGRTMRERIWINRAATEIVFQPSTHTLATRCTMRV